MGLPIMDIAISNKPVAFLISGINTLKIIKLKNIRRGFFIDKDHGIFMIDRESNSPLVYGKQSIFFYDVRSAKPIDMLMMKELDEFCDQNGLMSVTPKHVKQGEKLRMAELKQKMKKPKRKFFRNPLKKNQVLPDEEKDLDVLEELNLESEKLEKNVKAELTQIDKGLSDENEKLVKAGKPMLEITPEDYTEFILDRLVKKSLISYEDATTLKLKLINGQLTLDDFARELETLHKIEIHRPISTNAQKFLQSYKTYAPAEVFQYIQEARGLGKDIKDLGQPMIKNLIPAKWIVMVAMAGVIVIAVLSTVDFGTIKGLIPFLN